MKLKPYLNFNGQCEEAFTFYKSILGGELVTLFRYGEVDEATLGFPVSDEAKQRIMHCDWVGNGIEVAGCDRECGILPVVGTNVMLDMIFDTEQEISHAYQALKEGGKVLVPLGKVFFSPNFAMLTDKYGVTWILYQAPAK